MKKYNTVSLKNTIKTFPLSHSGTGRFFSEYHKDHLMYSDIMSSWYKRANGKWVKHSTVKVKYEMQGFIDTLAQKAEQDIDALGVAVYEARVKEYGKDKALTLEKRPIPRNQIPKYIRYYSGLCDDATTLALVRSSEKYMHREDIHADDIMKMVCKNKVLQFNRRGTCTVIDREPLDFSIQSSDVEYGFNATCPRWIQFIEEITCGDVEMAKFLQREAARMLTGEIKGSKINLLHGVSGHNGKTVFLETLFCLLGEYSTYGSTDLIIKSATTKERSLALNEMVGMRMVLVSETPESSSLNEERVKSLIDNGGTIKTRGLYESEKMTRATAKIWVCTNHKPSNKVSQAAKKRINSVIFRGHFIDSKVCDLNLQDKLHAERSGVLNWLMDGYKMLVEGSTGSQYQPEDINVMEVRDSLLSFTALLSTSAPSDTDVFETVDEAYKRYTDMNTHEDIPTKKELLRELRALGFETQRKRVCAERKAQDPLHRDKDTFLRFKG